MPKSPDALRGVKHKEGVELVHEKTLPPFSHFTPPEVPHDLTVKLYNMSPNKTYLVCIYEVVDSIKMPKHRSSK